MRARFFDRQAGNSGYPAPHMFVHPKNQMTFATICSGTEIPSIAVAKSVPLIKEIFQPDEIVEALAIETGCTAQLELSMKQVFLCEKDDDKRTFASSVADSLGHKEACVFKDAGDLRKGEAWCFKHQRTCKVPRADGPRGQH